MYTYQKIKLALAVCMVVFLFFGCAQQNAYQRKVSQKQPLVAKADGLVVAGKFTAVLIEDMDNDGHLDIVGSASSPGMVTISYGDGEGAVSEPQVLPVHGEVRSIAVADVDEDGLRDILFSARRETSGIRVWMNQAQRKWKQQNGPIKINIYEHLKTGDVNSDGHMDVIAANSTSDTIAGIQVWLGDGKGGWFGEFGPTTMGRYMGVALADLNQDGFLDLSGAGWGTYGAVRVWLGHGNGMWTATPPLMKGSYYGVNIGDVNDDGNFDIIAATYRKGVQIFLGDGKGSFQTVKGPLEQIKGRRKAQPDVQKQNQPNLTGEESFWQALPVDLDGDRQLDIIASSLDNNGILAWKNSGENRWRNYGGQFPSVGIYYGLATGDINRDGATDICAANFGEGIQILPGTIGQKIAKKNMEIEQLSASDRMAAFEAPKQNHVFTTINGVAEYRIGPGDLLEIHFWEAGTSKKEEILVQQNGKISFGFVEDLSVNGLTASQLDELLTKDLEQYFRKPRIDIFVKEHNSKSVTLLGAITPKNVGGGGSGKYLLSGRTTLLEILTKAGGATENANLKTVNIRRKNGTLITLDLFKAIHEGDPDKDFVLDDGDLVFLPTLDIAGNRVYVFGEVEKPGTYSFKSSKIRLADAISEAGGPTVFAEAAETRVVRGEITRPEILLADLQGLIENGDQSQNIALVNGDLVYVPRSWIGNVNRLSEQLMPLWQLLKGPGSVYRTYK
jgi:protein involved in polysaccharide export with SLBB domain